MRSPARVFNLYANCCPARLQFVAEARLLRADTALCGPVAQAIICLSCPARTHARTHSSGSLEAFLGGDDITRVLETKEWEREKVSYHVSLGSSLNKPNRARNAKKLFPPPYLGTNVPGFITHELRQRASIHSGLFCVYVQKHKKRVGLACLRQCNFDLQGQTRSRSPGFSESYKKVSGKNSRDICILPANFSLQCPDIFFLVFQNYLFFKIVRIRNICIVFFSSGAPHPMSEVRHRPVGPHPVLLRAGGPAQPRPHRTGLPARGEDAPQQAQAGHQVQAEEGRNRQTWPRMSLNRDDSG